MVRFVSMFPELNFIETSLGTNGFQLTPYKIVVASYLVGVFYKQTKLAAKLVQVTNGMIRNSNNANMLTSAALLGDDDNGSGCCGNGHDYHGNTDDDDDDDDDDTNDDDEDNEEENEDDIKAISNNENDIISAVFYLHRITFRLMNSFDCSFTQLITEMIHHDHHHRHVPLSLMQELALKRKLFQELEESLVSILCDRTLAHFMRLLRSLVPSTATGGLSVADSGGGCHPASMTGQYIRRVTVTYERLSFAQQVALYNDFMHYLFGDNSNAATAATIATPLRPLPKTWRLVLRKSYSEKELDNISQYGTCEGDGGSIFTLSSLLTSILDVDDVPGSSSSPPPPKIASTTTTTNATTLENISSGSSSIASPTKKKAKFDYDDNDGQISSSSLTTKLKMQQPQQPPPPSPFSSSTKLKQHPSPPPVGIYDQEEEKKIKLHNFTETELARIDSFNTALAHIQCPIGCNDDGDDDSTSKSSHYRYHIDMLNCNDQYSTEYAVAHLQHQMALLANTLRLRLTPIRSCGVKCCAMITPGSTATTSTKAKQQDTPAATTTKSSNKKKSSKSEKKKEKSNNQPQTFQIYIDNSDDYMFDNSAMDIDEPSIVEVVIDGNGCDDFNDGNNNEDTSQQQPKQSKKKKRKQKANRNNSNILNVFENDDEQDDDNDEADDENVVKLSDYGTIYQYYLKHYYGTSIDAQYCVKHGWSKALAVGDNDDDHHHVDVEKNDDDKQQQQQQPMIDSDGDEVMADFEDHYLECGSPMMASTSALSSSTATAAANNTIVGLLKNTTTTTDRDGYGDDHNQSSSSSSSSPATTSLEKYLPLDLSQRSLLKQVYKILTYEHAALPPQLIINLLAHHFQPRQPILYQQMIQDNYKANLNWARRTAAIESSRALGGPANTAHQINPTGQGPNGTGGSLSPSHPATLPANGPHEMIATNRMTKNLYMRKDFQNNMNFLKYINALRVNNYTSALEAFHLYFDLFKPTLGRTKATLNPVWLDFWQLYTAASYCWSTLNLAIMHVHFRHYRLAYEALLDCISSARERRNETCLQYAMTWLLLVLQHLTTDYDGSGSGGGGSNSSFITFGDYSPSSSMSSTIATPAPSRKALMLANAATNPNLNPGGGQSPIISRSSSMIDSSSGSSSGTAAITAGAGTGSIIHRTRRPSRKRRMAKVQTDNLNLIQNLCNLIAQNHDTVPYIAAMAYLQLERQLHQRALTPSLLDEQFSVTIPSIESVFVQTSLTLRRSPLNTKHLLLAIRCTMNDVLERAYTMHAAILNAYGASHLAMVRSNMFERLHLHQLMDQERVPLVSECHAIAARNAAHYQWYCRGEYHRALDRLRHFEQRYIATYNNRLRLIISQAIAEIRFDRALNRCHWPLALRQVQLVRCINRNASMLMLAELKRRQREPMAAVECLDYILTPASSIASLEHAKAREGSTVGMIINGSFFRQTTTPTTTENSSNLNASAGGCGGGGGMIDEEDCVVVNEHARHMRKFDLSHNISSSGSSSSFATTSPFPTMAGTPTRVCDNSASHCRQLPNTLVPEEERTLTPNVDPYAWVQCLLKKATILNDITALLDAVVKAQAHGFRTLETRAFLEIARIQAELCQQYAESQRTINQLMIRLLADGALRDLAQAYHLTAVNHYYLHNQGQVDEPVLALNWCYRDGGGGGGPGLGPGPNTSTTFTTLAAARWANQRALIIWRRIQDRAAMLDTLQLAAFIEHTSGNWDARNYYAKQARLMRELIATPHHVMSGGVGGGGQQRQQQQRHQPRKQQSTTTKP